jgi:imidazolonepropionase-like amidohydrolase
MAAGHMAMVPTLKMFGTTVTEDPGFLDPIYNEVREFHALGGELLFGTDVGYMTDYSTEGEFAALAKCGLDARAMLRMLTTAPAHRFGVAGSKGRVAPGYDGDLVVLAGDPAAAANPDPAANPAANLARFAQVDVTVRAGRVVDRRAR